MVLRIYTDLTRHIIRTRNNFDNIVATMTSPAFNNLLITDYRFTRMIRQTTSQTNTVSRKQKPTSRFRPVVGPHIRQTNRTTKGISTVRRLNSLTTNRATVKSRPTGPQQHTNVSTKRNINNILGILHTITFSIITINSNRQNQHIARTRARTQDRTTKLVRTRTKLNVNFTVGNSQHRISTNLHPNTYTRQGQRATGRTHRRESIFRQLGPRFLAKGRHANGHRTLTDELVSAIRIVRTGNKTQKLTSNRI